MKHERHSTSSRSSLPAVAGFLLPNFLGLICFTFLPIVLSLFMTFTNWSLKPSVNLHFVGLRNYIDILAMSPVKESRSLLCWSYVGCAIMLTAGFVGVLWAHVARWRGARTGGAALALMGACAVVVSTLFRGSPGVAIGGVAGALCGLWAAAQEEGSWKLGRGVVPSLLIGVGAAGLWILHQSMWQAYECRDLRFWKYLYNTAFLMLAVPFSIGGSLILALLLNDRLPFGQWRRRTLTSLLSAVCAVASLIVGVLVGHPNAGVLAALFWLVAGLGLAFNVVAFRTLYYLPTFTAGVALMILWQALYNPDTGPINQIIGAVAGTLGVHVELPRWLGSVAWAKPALALMFVWTAIGGTNMLLYLAGLSNIPRDLLDAAEVDGAGSWDRFRHITWPQLAPTTFFITVTAIIGGLQAGFEQARVMTQGGPAGSTTTLSYYIYQKLFEDLDLGYAATISWVLFGVIFLATMVNWRFTKGFEAEV